MFFFFNFLAIFMEFSITLRVRTERNYNFYFHSFSSVPNLFWLKMNTYWYFFNFFDIFFLILYYPSGRNETERWFLFSIFLIPYCPILAWNEAIMIFLNFLAIFMEFSIALRVGTKRNDNFYFHAFSAFSNLFGLETKP